MQKISSRCARKMQQIFFALRAQNAKFFFALRAQNAKFFFALRAQNVKFFLRAARTNAKFFFALRAQNAKLFFALHAENATSGLQSVCNHLASLLSFLSVLEKQLLVKKTVCLGSSLRCHLFFSHFFSIFSPFQPRLKNDIEKTSKKLRKSRLLVSKNLSKTLPKTLPNRCSKK